MIPLLPPDSTTWARLQCANPHSKRARLVERPDADFLTLACKPLLTPAAAYKHFISLPDLKAQKADPFNSRGRGEGTDIIVLTVDDSYVVPKTDGTTGGEAWERAKS